MPEPQPPQPPHPLPALTTSELTRYRRQLEHALTGMDPAAAASGGLRRKLDQVLAEQDSRVALTANLGRQDP